MWATHLVDILVRTRRTEPVEAELLVRVLLPAHGGHNLDRERGNAVGQDAQLVILRLAVKDLEARHRDDTCLDAVVVGEVLGGLDTDRHLRTSREERDVRTLNFLEDITTQRGLLDGRALELGKVLARESENAGAVLVGEGNLVRCARLVTVGRAPDHAVRKSTEVRESLNRLVGGAVLTQADRVVGGNPDDADTRQRGETNRAGTVRDEVEEGTTVGEDGAIRGQTVHDGAHTVLADTEANVAARVVTETVGGGLEVHGTLPPRQVGAREISRPTKQLGDDGLNLAEDGLGELAGRNGGIGGGVDRKSFLPALGELTLQAPKEVLVLGGVALGVLGQKLVPLGLGGSALGSGLGIRIVDLLGNVEGLVGVEAELFLKLLDVVGLEGRAVDTVGALLGGAEANGGGKLDQGRLVLDTLGLLEGSGHSGKVAVTLLDLDDMPAVGLVPLGYVFGEGTVRAAINGDLVVVPHGNEVAKLEVPGQRRGLTGDTLHQATVAEEAVRVVVDNIEVRLVEDRGGVRLGDGEANGIGDTLAQGTSGDLNARGIMRLRVTRGDAVYFLYQINRLE